jgi:hypothetical protein
MSRAINLNLTEAAVRKACNDVDVEISVIEALEPSGIRLVCSSANGAAAVRHKLRTSVIDGPVKRSRMFQGGMQPFAQDAPAEPRRVKRDSPFRDPFTR